MFFICSLRRGEGSSSCLRIFISLSAEQWTVTNMKLILCVTKCRFPYCCRKSYAYLPLDDIKWWEVNLIRWTQEPSNPRCQAILASKYCAVACNTCGPQCGYCRLYPPGVCNIEVVFKYLMWWCSRLRQPSYLSTWCRSPEKCSRLEAWSTVQALPIKVPPCHFTLQWTVRQTNWIKRHKDPILKQCLVNIAYLSEIYH
jgi:hypothetical protein